MRGVRYEPQSRRIRDVREVLEFLRDFSLGGGLHPEGLGTGALDEKADDKERAGSRVDQPLLGELVLSKCSPSYAILEAILELTFVFLDRCTWRGKGA